MAAGLCIAGLIVILSLFLWLSENTKLKKAINKIPGPPTLPIVGNAHQFKPDGSGIKLAILVHVRNTVCGINNIILISATTNHTVISQLHI